ncbi:MAG: ribosomal protein S18-alanine N-acetyltransferase [Succinivibrio sp.]
MVNERFYVRVLTLEDIGLLPQIEKIEYRTQKNAWSGQSLKECFDDSYILLGLFDTQKLIGFSLIYNTRFTNDLLTIGVDPDYQGRKLGALLLQRTLEKAVAIGDEECFLEVRVSNTVAQNLYTKFGFKNVGLRKEYYNPVGDEPAEDAYTMSLINIKEQLERMK